MEFKGNMGYHSILLQNYIRGKGRGGFGVLNRFSRWGRYKKRASPRRIKSRPFIHCLLTPKKLNSRMSLFPDSLTIRLMASFQN